MKALAASVAILALLDVTIAHVSLTYPIPRQIDYDFLDNIRTDPPCGGQPKGKPLSVLTAGEDIVVAWHLGYPHRGGFRVELLQPDDNVSEAIQLYPATGTWGGEGDTTQTQIQVSIPNVDCTNCTLRFMRQALEWGDTYTFWTCADINIYTGKSEFCSNQGTYANDACTCNPLFYGDRCQFKNECEVDNDCSNGGECVDTFAVSNPRKQCFCPAGFFGEKCAKVSSVKSLNMDLSTYRKATMSSDFILYHKIVGDEIEMVAKVKTNTWAGIGWKPTGQSSCRNLDHGTPEPEGEVSSPEPEPSTPASPTTPGVTAAGSATTSSPGPQTVYITSETDYLESQGLQASLANYSCTVGSGGQAVPEPETGGATSEKSTAEPEPEVEPEVEPESEGRDTAHPMDCTDMVIMAARGKFSRIHDAYTRDRSTPKFDTILGAENSLTAAIGEESGEYTTVLFRRKLAAGDARDHTIEDAPMSVIWAYGQEHFQYNHSPFTGLEFCTVRDIFFYRKDVLMYHGRSGKRGASTINFVTAPPASDNSFQINEETFVKWNYDDGTKNVEFELNAPLGVGDWVALGITSDRKMADTDVIHVGVDSTGTAVASDRYATAYALPGVDKAPSGEISTSMINGKLVATITRSADTTSDGNLPVNGCQYLTIASGSGFTGTSFGKHSSTPSISESKYCFTSDARVITANSVLLAVLLAFFALLK